MQRSRLRSPRCCSTMLSISFALPAVRCAPSSSRFWNRLFSRLLHCVPSLQSLPLLPFSFYTPTFNFKALIGCFSIFLESSANPSASSLISSKGFQMFLSDGLLLRCSTSPPFFFLLTSMVSWSICLLHAFFLFVRRAPNSSFSAG